MHLNKLEKHTVFDMMGREVEVPVFPHKIVSLVPSQTELLHDLGLGNRVVGITKFCVHPESWYRNKKRVGGTKTPHLDKIESLNPDLVIGNKEENDKDCIQAISEKFPVWMSEIYTYQDALEMIQRIGDLVQKKHEALSLVQDIQKQVKKPSSELSNCLYFIWRNPWMIAGEQVFINEMLRLAGFRNAISGSAFVKELKEKNKNARYPEITSSEIKEINPEHILLSSEPFPFKEKHIDELKHICPNANIRLVDGELFSWYGSRMKLALKYFNKLRN